VYEDSALDVDLARIDRPRKTLPCAAIQIPRNGGRRPVCSDGEPGGLSVITSSGLRIAEAASNIPVVIGGLGRNNRCESIYRTLGVAGQKDFRSGKDFMKDAASRSGRDGVYDEWLGKERDKHTNRNSPDGEDSFKHNMPSYGSNIISHSRDS
jgi:hypothetical protein